jgi:WXG100 family type VII secretion target
MRYRVELDALSAFVDRLGAFEHRAEAIAARVDEQFASLHSSWSGQGATAHLAQHREWRAASRQMREALAQLRETARTAQRNYTDAVKVNMAMLT